jgi:hypothetical protein
MITTDELLTEILAELKGIHATLALIEDNTAAGIM